jgi:hypothetical protein
MSNFFGDHGDVDYLVTPSFDLSALQDINLSFHFSSATSTSSISLIDDALNIYSSTNCGKIGF